MKIISFDVGIKNLAFCILDIDSSTKKLSISNWMVLNLMDKEEPPPTCNCLSEPKKTKTGKKDKTEKKESVICGKPSIFKKDTIFYCKKHSNSQTQYCVPSNKWSEKTLKKLKIDEINKILIEHSISNVPFPTKKASFAGIAEHLKNKCLEPVINKKEKTAGETDLIVIGRNMAKLLDEIPQIIGINGVIIENQISPIANRMKTIQGMLAQYFILRCPTAFIEFVSSSGKLRQFSGLKAVPENVDPSLPTNNLQNPPKIVGDSPQNVVLSTENNVEGTPLQNNGSEPNTYKDRKQDGVYYTRKLIAENYDLADWSQTLETKKKDDLADCFLQGLWYLGSKKIIRYAENLKIIIV